MPHHQPLEPVHARQNPSHHQIHFPRIRGQMQRNGRKADPGTGEDVAKIRAVGIGDPGTGHPRAAEAKIGSGVEGGVQRGVPNGEH